MPRDHFSQRMAVIRIAGQRLHMGDELAALAVLEGGGHADLDAELIRLVGLALADALHFGCMQAVDLGAALPALLLSQPPAKAQQMSKAALEPTVAIDLAGNVADDAAQIGLELAQRLVGALELAGMSVALMHNKRTHPVTAPGQVVLGG
jgi:hypothetical protein